MVCLQQVECENVTGGNKLYEDRTVTVLVLPVFTVPACSRCSVSIYGVPGGWLAGRWELLWHALQDTGEDFELALSSRKDPS